MSNKAKINSIKDILKDVREDEPTFHEIYEMVTGTNKEDLSDIILDMSKLIQAVREIAYS